jgi:hypothetical protein
MYFVPFEIDPPAAWPLHVLLSYESLRWEPGLILLLNESSSPVLEVTREFGNMETCENDTLQTEDRSSAVRN